MRWEITCIHHPHLANHFICSHECHQDSCWVSKGVPKTLQNGIANLGSIIQTIAARKTCVLRTLFIHPEGKENLDESTTINLQWLQWAHTTFLWPKERASLQAKTWCCLIYSRSKHKKILSFQLDVTKAARQLWRATHRVAQGLVETCTISKFIRRNTCLTRCLQWQIRSQPLVQTSWRLMYKKGNVGTRQRWPTLHDPHLSYPLLMELEKRPTQPLTSPHSWICWQPAQREQQTSECIVLSFTGSSRI